MAEKISGVLTFFLIALAFFPGFLVDKSLKDTRITAYTVGEEGIEFKEGGRFQFTEKIGFWEGCANGAMVVAQSGKIAASNFAEDFNFRKIFSNSHGELEFSVGKLLYFIGCQLVNLFISIFVFLFGFLYWSFQIFRMGSGAAYYGGIVSSIGFIFLVFAWSGRERRPDINHKPQAPVGGAAESAPNGDTTLLQTSENTQKINEQLLGLKPGYSDADLKAAYRIKISEYHPDKVNHLGDKLKALANQESIEIQNAYEHLASRNSTL